MNLRSTPLMLPFEDCLGVHNSRPFLIRLSFPRPHIRIYSAAVTALAIQVLASVSQTARSKLTVDAQLAVSNHLLDLSFLLQIIQRLPCETAIYLQSIHKGGDCDETVGLNVFVEFVGGGFVEDDGVVGLVLDF